MFVVASVVVVAAATDVVIILDDAEEIDVGIDKYNNNKKTLHTRINYNNSNNDSKCV